MIYQKDDIKMVHLELTDKCNASCPQCARNKFGGPENEKLPSAELYLSDIQQIFDKPFVNQLKKISLCGNFGDPINAKDTLEIVRYLLDVNPNLAISMNTNGSARTVKWWSEMGSLLQGRNNVIFSIDGLEDTNHIYRRGTFWNKIIENAKSFIDNGGNAYWDFIVFKHNEHQIEEASKLSSELGFKRIQFKKTGRFFSNNQMKNKDKQEVYTRDGNLDYYIEPTTLNDYKNDSLQKTQSLVDKHGSFETYLNQTTISCKVAEEKNVYISSEGLLFPCCWVSGQMYVWFVDETPIEKLLNKCGGKDLINLKHNDFNSILSGSFFQEIENSWNLPSCKDGKLKVCSIQCGQDFNPFNSQFK